MRTSPLRYLVSLLFGIALHAQSVPSLRPPEQTYRHNFNSFSAIAPVTPILNLGATYSIEIWVMLNPDARDTQFMRVFSKAAYELDLDPGTHQLTYYQVTGGGHIGVTLVPGQWYHVAIVSDNLQVTLYLNGQQQARFTASGPPPINSLPLVLSGQPFGDGTKFCCGFPGSFRQLRIWSRALQAAEIPLVATKVLAGNEAGLVADWPLDDGQGETLHDLGPNHMTLNLTKTSPSPFDSGAGWLRTAIADGGPYFQVQKLMVPQATLKAPTVTIPIDFDSDGKVDLLICQHSGTLDSLPCAAFRNDGKGNFSDVTLQVLGPNPPGFQAAGDYAVADFNGDGRADVFVSFSIDCCEYPGSQSILLLQTADGRLADATATHLPHQILNTQRMASGDIDGDGDVDLFLSVLNTTVGQGSPQIYLNDGQGHFTVGDQSRLPAILRGPPFGLTGFSNSCAKFVDLNQDGQLDLVLGSIDQSSWPRDLLLLNDGHGFFRLAPDNALPTRYGGRDWGTLDIQVVDFDGDGWPDLINTVYALHYVEGAVQILLNNHDGTFRDATERILQPAWPRHTSLWGDGLTWVDPVYPADLNGDGFVDLLVQGNGTPSRLFLNTGPAGGGRLVEVSEILPHVPDFAISFVVADLNGDGSPDIASWTECCSPSTLESWISVRKFTLTPDLIPAMPAGPFFLRGNVLNSASYSADALAPGELVTIFGRNLGPGTLAVASPNGAYPTELSGTRVLFNNVAAPIIYTSAGQVSVVVPFSVIPKTRADVVVEYQATRSPPVSIFVEGSAPGLFTIDSSGVGPGAILNVDAVTGKVTVNSPQNPALRGGIIVAYFTGAGQTDPPSVDGVLATAAGRMELPLEAGLSFFGPSNGSIGSGQDTTHCTSALGCLPLQVLYAGPAPGIVAGVIQVNMRLPASVTSGTYSLGIAVSGIWGQLNATVSVR